MKQYIEIKCRRCGAETGHRVVTVRNAMRARRVFTMNAWRPGIKDQIEKQTLSSGGVRDISRNLGISKNTVISELKKTPAEVNPFFTSFSADLEIEIRTEAEVDEVRNYVGKKKNQRWMWHAVERTVGAILAWHNGRRANESCSLLMDKLSTFPIKISSVRLAFCMRRYSAWHPMTSSVSVSTRH